MSLDHKNDFFSQLMSWNKYVSIHYHFSLAPKKAHIKKVIKSEETSFLKTLDKGISKFEDVE